MVSTKKSHRAWFGRGLPYVAADELRGKLIVIEGTDGVGRSTQVVALREWLEVQGLAVVETGWTRSRLVGPAIARAKEGHALNPLTFALIYACDFAERLEGEILPALRAGSVVLSDRYIYTALARNIVRGLPVDWVRRLFGFAPVPDLVFYLDIDLPTLVRRVLRARRLNYWESGVDLALGSDLYDCFVEYQRRLLAIYDAFRTEFDFISLDARQRPERIQREIRVQIGRRLLAVSRLPREVGESERAGNVEESGGAVAPAAPPAP